MIITPKEAIERKPRETKYDAIIESVEADINRVLVHTLSFAPELNDVYRKIYFSCSNHMLDDTPSHIRIDGFVPDSEVWALAMATADRIRESGWHVTINAKNNGIMLLVGQYEDIIQTIQNSVDTLVTIMNRELSGGRNKTSQPKRSSSVGEVVKAKNNESS